MSIYPFRKNISLFILTLIALGIMLFLLLMPPIHHQDSLVFFTHDGKEAGAFRVTITGVSSSPAYTEIKIIPEDIKAFHSFMLQFHNIPLSAKLPSFGSHIIIPGRDIQHDGILRLVEN